MKRYFAFYKGKRLEVCAASLLEARTKAAKQFKALNENDVGVSVAEKWMEP